ncbi:probable methyltransferase TARBP1 isoform X2 [Oryzias melastigma]|uniref:probable methyltransferase TARBP1 isoform X2 n=1 Tax=Oryzias melastigma TaxID=30732 RepID=UPI000CF8387C|nr:probable methyltransferase TARBP1 isoform X2 [Oryzias melastigma]
MMHSVLINAVLLSSPDYEVLLGSLLWPSETWPETERVEALAALIEGLGELLSRSDPQPVTDATRRSIMDQIESVIWTRCMPLLSKISAEPGEDARCRESTAAVCRLLRVCVARCSEDAWKRAAQFILPSLQPQDEVLPGGFSVEVASESLASLIPFLSTDDHLTDTILSAALASIRSLPDASVPRIIMRIISTLLRCCSGARSSSILRSILEHMCSWHSSENSAIVTERSLLCLTSLSDHLFQPHSSDTPDPRLYVQFWRIVQDGLTHTDSLTRKRALYLLKRGVALSEEHALEVPSSASEEDEMLFSWAADRLEVLRNFWEDYVLVMETLEENQIHVVRPVLNRIDTLIETTVNSCQGSGWGLFHPSWLLCVYHRMFHSENKSLTKEGVCHLVELHVLQHPAFASSFSQFIVGSFMDVLSESSLFHRSPVERVGECPELAVKLRVFMATFFTSLPQEERRGVLLQLIQQLSSKHWSAVPLLFVCESLSKLPLEPLLGTSGLAAIREVLRCTMITHQVLLRGAAQCFLLNSALSLTVVSEVTLDDVFSFLMCFRPDESLCRGTQLWNQVCAWLLKHEGSFKPRIIDGDLDAPSHKKETVKAHVQEALLAFLVVPACSGQNERLPDSREADKLARAVLLCVEMQRSQELISFLDSLLSPLLDTLSRVSTNMYQPLSKSDKSLQLLLRLCELVAINQDKEDDVQVAVKAMLFRLFDPILEFILRQLCGGLQELCDVERADLYLCVLRQLVVVCSSSSQHCSKMHQIAFPKLIKFGLTALQNQTQRVPTVADQVPVAVAMASLAAVCDLAARERTDMQSETISALKSLNDYFFNLTTSSQHQACFGCINHRLVKPQLTDSGLEAQGILQQDWGLIAARFMRDQWICLNFLFKTFGIPASTADAHKAALLCGLEALTLLPSDLVLPVLSFIQMVLPHLVGGDEALCVQTVTCSWELVQGLNTNAHDFWPALRGFIHMAFQRRLLSLPKDQAPDLKAALKQIASELLELSQTKSGVYGVLTQHCCQTWLDTDGGFTSVFNYLDIVTEACVYGPLMRKDQRLIQDVHIYVEQLGGACAANIAVTNCLLFCSDNRDDQLPRICVLAFLSRLDSTNVLHQRLMEELVFELLKKDAEISKSKTRYHSNSLQHRVKNRVWQTLLMLLPKLKEEFVDTLLKPVFEAGFGSNHASVKYLIEWMMVLILVRCPQHIESLWVCFSKAHEHTKTSICTFLSVLVHLNVIVPHLKDKVVHLRKALDVILQSCLSHNFSVRLYALLALKRVWHLTENMVEEAEALRSLSSVVGVCLTQAEAMQSTGNASKNWIRIQEHFFFGCFHPTRDFSVETIFYTFPSLSELTDDEWIPLWKFEKFVKFAESPSLPLRNGTRDLEQVQPGDWIQQDCSEQGKEERWAEVQKKITPSRLGIQEQEPELQLIPPQRAARLGKQPGALLVVASLIDKPTNLGGLCRTCEIFGASALVLDSLRHVTDKHFQSLSVSSELWLPLLEVKPMELTEFLQMKKSEGYCIVGVEQTANSQSLQDYRFPEKTLLLLGNEREGIPANLLQMLDVCVEIPQQGVIRSLNVHVSAALLIWEYTRQRLTSDSTKVGNKRE